LENVLRLKHWDSQTCQLIKSIIEDSFHEELVPHYFDQPLEKIYLLPENRGVGILSKLNAYIYLDKLAVAHSAKGLGLGKQLFNLIRAEQPHLIWRASKANAFTGFYKEVADDFVEGSVWTVYWSGLDKTKLAPIIEELNKKERDFIPETDPKSEVPPKVADLP